MRTRFNHLTRCASFLLLFSSFAIVTVRAEDESGGDIQQAMTPEQFEAAGLNKLSSKELKNLNAWLQGDREKVAQKTAAKTKGTKLKLVVSRIDGPFDGLTGRTIIKLQDGTTWRQANPSDRYRGPGGENLGVAVTNAGLFGYKMRIEGTQEFYVDRINP